MEAAVLHAVNNMAVMETETPGPGNKEVLIRVAYTGVCGTDRHILHGEFSSNLPLIPGHEISGGVFPEAGGWQYQNNAGDAGKRS